MIGLEGIHSLLWGRELLDGDLEHFAGGPTPRPLLIVAGGLVSLLGDDAAYTAYSLAFGPLLLGVVVAATIDVGWQLASPWAGLLAASVLLTSPVLLDWGATASHELAFAALVLCALALELDRPRRVGAPLALLALAGLIHPKAWLFAAAYLIWLGPALRGRRILAYGLALLAPVLWLALDAAVTGDALWSLRTGGGGRVEALEGGGRDLANAVGPLALIIGVAAYVPAMRARLGGLSLMLNLLGLAVLTFLVTHVALGSADDPALPVAICLVAVLAAIPASGARFAPPALALLAAFALVFQGAIRLDTAVEVTRDLRPYERVVDEADALADRPSVRSGLARCERAAAPTASVAAVFAYFSGRDSSRWRVDPRGRARADVFVAPASRAAAAALGGTRRATAFRALPGLRASERTSAWRLFRDARTCPRRSPG